MIFSDIYNFYNNLIYFWIICLESIFDLVFEYTWILGIFNILTISFTYLQLQRHAWLKK